MAKAHPILEGHEIVVDRRTPGGGVDTQPLGRSPQEHGVTQRISSRHQQKPLGFRREPLDPLAEALLDAARELASAR